MTKVELIAKQQLEIEELKITIDDYKTISKDARAILYVAEQWNLNSQGFPKVAMRTICAAREFLQRID